MTNCIEADNKMKNISQIDANRIKDIYERFKAIEKQLRNQSDINLILLDKFKSIIKSDIARESEFVEDLKNRLQEIETQQRHDMDQLRHHNEWLLKHDELEDKIDNAHKELTILLIRMSNLDMVMSLAKYFDKNITDYSEDFDEVDESKTTGLTFEEAMTAFKAGKDIKFNDGMSSSNIYEPNPDVELWHGFSYQQILRDHWEIVK